MLLPGLKRISACLARWALLNWLGEAAVCVRSLRLSTRVVSLRLHRSRRWWLLIYAVLVVLIVVAPVVAIVCIFLCCYPLLRLRAINIRFKGYRLAGREGRSRAVTVACQLWTLLFIYIGRALQRRLGRLLIEAIGARHAVNCLYGSVEGVRTHFKSGACAPVMNGLYSAYAPAASLRWVYAPACRCPDSARRGVGGEVYKEGLRGKLVGGVTVMVGVYQATSATEHRATGRLSTESCSMTASQPCLIDGKEVDE